MGTMTMDQNGMVKVTTDCGITGIGKIRLNSDGKGRCGWCSNITKIVGVRVEVINEGGSSIYSIYGYCKDEREDIKMSVELLKTYCKERKGHYEMIEIIKPIAMMWQ